MRSSRQSKLSSIPGQNATILSAVYAQLFKASCLENLALACIHCNRFKGPNLAGIDPNRGEIVRLFNPRRDIWSEHFEWSGPELKALTSIGRVTIEVLSINDSEMRNFRAALMEEGLFEEDM
jgi:hypothetical protein